MTNKAIFIPADPLQEIREQESKPPFEDMQTWVGGYVQGTPCIWEGRRATLVVNEDGIGLGLAINKRVRPLVQDAYPGHEDQVQQFSGNAIVLVGWRLS